jgi:DNA (cytosine-5)-methyltransferase 1
MTKSIDRKSIDDITYQVSNLGAFMDGDAWPSNGLYYASLFSGGGIGDVGLIRAGWTCIAACEKDELRRGTFAKNIPGAKLFGDIRDSVDDIVEYIKRSVHDLDLLLATPPCQSFSTANSRRGSHSDPEVAAKDSRNSLFFQAILIAKKIQPKIIVIENVPNFFMRKVRSPDGRMTGMIGEFLDSFLGEYRGYKDTMCLSSFGIPQRRKRALAIYVRRDLVSDGEKWQLGEYLVLPPAWPQDFRVTPLTAEAALARFKPLDGENLKAAVDPSDRLHVVPTYDTTRYRWISEIPPNSGRGAYENSVCPSCGTVDVEMGLAYCPSCGEPMVNRPHVSDPKTGLRLIKGFKTSYRRMRADLPASTVTTASSHFGSDIKLHPSQNRVLSMRECAFLQTIPNDFDWSKPLEFKRKKIYALRQIIGEAVPSWFAFKLGLAAAAFIRNVTWQELAIESERT